MKNVNASALNESANLVSNAIAAAKQHIAAVRGAVDRVERQYFARREVYAQHAEAGRYFRPVIGGAIQRARAAVARYAAAGAEQQPGIHAMRCASFRATVRTLENEAARLLDGLFAGA
jgi:hypothetical protein